MKRIRLITLLIVVFAAASLVLSFRNKPAANPQDSSPSTAKLVTATDAPKLLADRELFVLDVHTPEQIHLPATDAFIPYDQLEQNLNKLPADKNAPILVYCRSGSMSETAAQTLIKLGYTNVTDLAGGLNAYREANVEVQLDPSNQNLGTMIYGDVATTSFTLTNFTPTPLKIARISTSCGCTSAKAQQSELAPWESTLIEVSFNPAVHKDDTDLGELTRTIYIETNNINFPKLTAEISAVVIKK